MNFVISEGSTSGFIARPAPVLDPAEEEIWALCARAGWSEFAQSIAASMTPSQATVALLNTVGKDRRI